MYIFIFLICVVSLECMLLITHFVIWLTIGFIAMPVTALIWPPDADHKYGHASLNTSKYHMSFWPNGCIKRDLSALDAGIGEGVEAALIFHQDLDYKYEGKREPRQYLLVNVTEDSVHSIYEEFLLYNNINPASVTMTEAEKLIRQRKYPEIVLSKTKYAYIVELVVDKRRTKSGWETFWHGSNRPFYHEAQSCVSFCFNIVEMADPNPQVCYVEPRHYNGPERSADHRVPWFENDIIKKYWISGCKRDDNNCMLS